MLKLPLTLEHALLGFVRERPRHAYEIHQQLEQAEALGLVWHLKQSQLYALIGKLEEEGYLNATVVQQGARAPRKLLALTPRGAAAFDHWLHAPVTHGRDIRQEFLAKLYFIRQEGPEAIRTLLDRQRDVCRNAIDDVASQRAVLADERVYEDLVLQFRVGQLNAVLDWLDVCEHTLIAATRT